MKNQNDTLNQRKLLRTPRVEKKSDRDREYDEKVALPSLRIIRFVSNSDQALDLDSEQEHAGAGAALPGKR